MTEERDIDFSEEHDIDISEKRDIDIRDADKLYEIFFNLYKYKVVYIINQKTSNK